MVKKHRIETVEYGGKWSGCTSWNDVDNAIVIEGRNEISILLKALRKYGTKKALKLAKDIFLIDTKIQKCPYCGHITNSGLWSIDVGDFKDAPDKACTKCFDKIRKNRFQKEKEKKEKEWKDYVASIELDPDIEACL